MRLGFLKIVAITLLVLVVAQRVLDWGLPALASLQTHILASMMMMSVDYRTQQTITQFTIGLRDTLLGLAFSVLAPTLTASFKQQVIRWVKRGERTAVRLRSPGIVERIGELFEKMFFLYGLTLVGGLASRYAGPSGTCIRLAMQAIVTAFYIFEYPYIFMYSL